ncbi:hypothetical protein HHK36_023201 [Tetracentron sinense]|uniref:Uncharacterized protein n=1 Tax=Tetracentron sinense TaxID=13715 RepID=A0A835D7P7_TETSI|nr:hypothetical protein HHK36_023201 [Tetracentron sinense]
MHDIYLRSHNGGILKAKQAVIVFKDDLLVEKAVIVRSSTKGLVTRPVRTLLVAGIGKYPQKVIRKGLGEEDRRRTTCEGVHQARHYNHSIPPRLISGCRSKGTLITPDSLQSRDKKVPAAKDQRARVEERLRRKTVGFLAISGFEVGVFYGI